MQYSNQSLSAEYIRFIYGAEFGLYSNMDEGKDGGKVKLELCPQLNTAVVETKKQA